MLLFVGLKTKFEVQQLGQDRFTGRKGGRRLTKQQVPKHRTFLISELVSGYDDFTKKLAQNSWQNTTSIL